MQFLANENFPLPSIVLLRKAGYSVSSVAELFPGLSDREVIKKAQEGNFVILTFDKDYGELLFKYGNERPPGVVFFRYKGESPDEVGSLLKSLLGSQKLKLRGHFTVIEKEGVRQRAY